MLSCAHCYDEGNVERQYLPGFGELNPMFRRAVSMYRRASEGRDPDDLTKDQIVRFLEDDLGSRQGLNFIGAWLPMSSKEILDGLREIAKIFRLSGLKGLVIALDEAEAIPRIGGSGVANAYSNLAALIDAAQRIEQTYFIYATTSTFFEDIRQYADSVARRVSSETRMDLARLTLSDFGSLAQKVAVLMAIASDGAVDEARVVKSGREIAESRVGAGAGSVRDFLTTLFAAVNEP